MLHNRAPVDIERGYEDVLDMVLRAPPRVLGAQFPCGPGIRIIGPGGAGRERAVLGRGGSACGGGLALGAGIRRSVGFRHGCRWGLRRLRRAGGAVRICL